MSHPFCDIAAGHDERAAARTARRAADTAADQARRMPDLLKPLLPTIGHIWRWEPEKPDARATDDDVERLVDAWPGTVTVLLDVDVPAFVAAREAELRHNPRTCDGAHCSTCLSENAAKGTARRTARRKARR